MAIYTVDRIEDGFVVLLLREDESIQRDVPIQELVDVSEGDLVDVSFHKDDSVLSYTILKEKTEEAKRNANELLQKLIKKNQK